MPFPGLSEILLSLLFFLLIRRLGNKNGFPTNWPFIGMFPSLLLNLHRVNDWITDLVCPMSDGTFLFKGPWFSEMSQILVTINPDNIHHVMSSNFANYPKGPEYRDIFDIFGTGIINTDGPTWKNQRKVAVVLVSHRRFYNYIVKASQDKVKSCLIPILDRFMENGSIVDVQDLFQRYTFDSTCKLITGFDPGSLSIELPEVPFATALEDSMEVIFYRHIVPHFVWKIQRRLGVGEEKKFMRAWRTFDEVIAEYIKKRREELLKEGGTRSDEQGTDLLASYIAMEKDEISGLDYNDDRFLRDTILNLLLAGRDTTGSSLAWFFWNLSRNPSVEKKIREEISSVSSADGELFPNINKLVYLHGAICESLRLYPPVHWQHKRPTEPDILPSGHVVTPKTRIMFNLYAMGRKTSIWGKDCLEFKPERWITDKGWIKHEPSFKFPAFAAGPRSCIGKELGLTQMKTVIAAIIQKFHLEVVEGHDATPSYSPILCMKNGLKVRVIKA